jgi:hypothetical protein
MEEPETSAVDFPLPSSMHVGPRGTGPAWRQHGATVEDLNSEEPAYRDTVHQSRRFSFRSDTSRLVSFFLLLC